MKRHTENVCPFLYLYDSLPWDYKDTQKSQNSWREIGDAVKRRLWWKDFSPRLWVWRLWPAINNFTFRHGRIISHTNMLFQANWVNIFQNNYVPDHSLSKEMWNKKMAQSKNSKLGVRRDSFSVGSCLITNVEPIPLVQCHCSAEDRGGHGLALITSRTTISWLSAVVPCGKAALITAQHATTRVMLSQSNWAFKVPHYPWSSLMQMYCVTKTICMLQLIWQCATHSSSIIFL